MTTALLHIDVTLKGSAPLLMHNERLANHFDPYAQAIKKITVKRSKQTDEERQEVLHLEWQGGLYLSETLGPYIPGANLKKCIMEAASLFKGGTAVKRALTPCEAEIPLIYAGPRDMEGLWETKTFVDIRSIKLNGRTKVSRARPRFEKWGLETSVFLNTSALSLDDFLQFINQAGATTGLGDYRPTFGRFLSETKVR